MHADPLPRFLLLPLPPPPLIHQAAPLCPVVGQRPLSVAQVVDRARSGAAASVAEACISIRILSTHCEFMARVGKPLKCPSLATVAVRTGLIPLFVGLLAKGGVAAYWAIQALLETCAARNMPPDQTLPDAQGDPGRLDARAAFLAAGGVGALVALLALPLRHPDLGKLLSPQTAASQAVVFLLVLNRDFECDHAFKVRCIDAGLVPPLLQLMALEGRGPGLLLNDGGATVLLFRLCCYRDVQFNRPGSAPEDEGRAVAAIATAVLNCGVARVIVKRLQLTEG